MNEQPTTIADVIESARRFIRKYKRRRKAGIEPEPGETEALQKAGTILLALLDADGGAVQDGLAELSLIIHTYAPPGE